MKSIEQSSSSFRNFLSERIFVNFNELLASTTKNKAAKLTGRVLPKTLASLLFASIGSLFAIANALAECPASVLRGHVTNLDLAVTSDEQEKSASAKLNSTLLSFLTVAKELYGLNGIEVGKDFQTNEDGSYTFHFEDPLKKMPGTVIVPALAKSIVTRDDFFHERFLLLCALEIACYHGGDRYESSAILSPLPYQSDKSLGFSTEKTPGTLVVLKYIKRTTDEVLDAIANPNLQSDPKKRDRMLGPLKEKLDEITNGEIEKHRFPYVVRDSRGVDALELISRIGYLLKRMLEDPALNRRVSSADLMAFAELMTSTRSCEHRFLNPNYSAEVRIHVDPINASRLQSFQRVYRHVTGSAEIPKLRGAVADFEKEVCPRFFIEQNRDGISFLIDAEHLMLDLGRVADKSSTGMLAMDDIYHYEDFKENGIDYFPAAKLPDVATALTSAYFFSVGFETKAGYGEVDFARNLAREIGVETLDKVATLKAISRTTNFESEKRDAIPVRILQRNSEDGPKRMTLYNQKLKEGGKRHASLEFNEEVDTVSREVRQRNRNRTKSGLVVALQPSRLKYSQIPIKLVCEDIAAKYGVGVFLQKGTDVKITADKQQSVLKDDLSRILEPFGLHVCCSHLGVLITKEPIPYNVAYLPGDTIVELAIPPGRVQSYSAGNQVAWEKGGSWIGVTLTLVGERPLEKAVEDRLEYPRKFYGVDRKPTLVKSGRNECLALQYEIPKEITVNGKTRKLGDEETVTDVIYFKNGDYLYGVSHNYPLRFKKAGSAISSKILKTIKWKSIPESKFDEFGR